MAAAADSAIAAACAAGAWAAAGERHVGHFFSRHVRQSSSTRQREVPVRVLRGMMETCHVSIARKPLLCFRRKRIRHQRLRQVSKRGGGGGGGEQASRNATSGVSRCCINNESATRSSWNADVDDKPVQSDVENEDGREASETLTITLSVAPSVSMVAPEDWDACAADAAGKGSFNPLISHAFFSSLEDSKSAVKGEGWYPQHLIAKDSSGKVLGVAPLYLKRYGATSKVGKDEKNPE
ncbi:hypothetical protein CBR_g48699 [Chara braunii]|uniref:Uncharacterized protein n=1 Tax=Chara braunii TaxID=69332 RepID=A0A388K4G8_CHABU|nr:hypothetical protein CBR_g48699 [Chara braunii]|eukprot:GBG64950.1 hypothetical protein CBR_g48699 [Chara braunii]